MGECLLARHGVGGGLPVGAIVLWSGAANAIPSGWHLCDGTSGTPDLRGRFVVGAGGSYTAGNTGGAASVALTEAQMPGHTHTCTEFSIPLSNSTYYIDEDAVYHTANGPQRVMRVTGTKGSSTIPNITLSEAGSGSAHENRPPYYALCYIMKVK